MARKSITKSTELKQSVSWSIEWDEGENIADQLGEMNMLAMAEDETVRCALRFTAGNITETAKLLGVARQTVYEKMRKFGIKVKKSAIISQCDNSDT